MLSKIVGVVGPTASGKTALAIEIAKKYNGEIVSCDSMQIYKYMNIGTAKPSYDEMQGIPHHLIDIIEPSQSFNVAEFSQMAKECISDILNRGKLPILAGGTGLYFDSVIKNIKFTEIGHNEEYCKELENLALIHGNEYVHNVLKEIDEASANVIHPNNLRRVIRALEIYKVSGKTMTQCNEESIQPPLYEPIIIGINMDRELLYDRINKRVDIMMENGLIDEVKHILSMGIDQNSTAMQAIGYKELVKYLNRSLGLDEAIEEIKLESRRYAKRQLTWFRKNKDIHWVLLQKDYIFDTIHEKSFTILKNLL